MRWRLCWPVAATIPEEVKDDSREVASAYELGHCTADREEDTIYVGQKGMRRKNADIDLFARREGEPTTMKRTELFRRNLVI